MKDYAPAVLISLLARVAALAISRGSMLLKTCGAIGVALSWLLFSAHLLAKTPVIEAGREQEVLALFAPYRLGEPVQGEWKLWNIRIEPSHILVELHGPGSPPSVAKLKLDHASLRPPGTFSHTKNFSLSLPEALPDQARPSIDDLIAALRRNDQRPFWQAKGYARGSRDLSGEYPLSAYLSDAGLGLIILTVFILGFFIVELRRTPSKIRYPLLAVLLLGALLRLTLTPKAALGVWSFSRIPPFVNSIIDGPTFAHLSAGRSEPYYLTDIIFGVGLLFGVLGPFVLFLHAKRLLGAYLPAAIAAGLLAVWPSHLRFSHTNDAFIPSIVLSSLTFVLVHEALYHPNRNWRFIALFFVPIIGSIAFELRPLNLLFAPLLLLVALWLDPKQKPSGNTLGEPAATTSSSTTSPSTTSPSTTSPSTAQFALEAPSKTIPLNRFEPTRSWRLSVAGVIFLSAALISTPKFLREHQEVASESLSPSLITETLRAFFSYKWNTLIRVEMTPYLALALVFLGGYFLYKENRRLLLFLAGWLLVFFLGHSVVLPGEPLLQARYHLHLIVPFILLAAFGLSRLAKLRRRTAIAVGALLLLSPGIYYSFITRLDLNEPAEHRYVQSLRPLIPEGCYIYEYVGARSQDSRLKHIGARVAEPPLAFNLELITLDAGPLEELLQSAAQRPCARVYLGVECYANHIEEATVCKELRAASKAVISEVEFADRPYDDNYRQLTAERGKLRLGLYQLSAEPLK